MSLSLSAMNHSPLFPPRVRARGLSSGSSTASDNDPNSTMSAPPALPQCQNNQSSYNSSRGSMGSMSISASWDSYCRKQKPAASS
eukprot:CAMPEP_0194287290 /NCGR_PEP_ID=MMETSP0169-20130528/34408_1 /TAXON_ID=218684 /ORGANISM="Corethron pennatum, Strain L29A3" /LENGTH=84 /DNA_ID=CAMNT_0039033939 /DNA_START=182 /DNA_END=433 /DNA_ORIENTATION=-